MIYVLRAKGTKFYKVGWTDSHRAEDRLGQLQPGCPHELEVIAFADGTQRDEQEFHRLLTDAGLHVRGEWFKTGSLLETVISVLKAMPRPNPFKMKLEARNPHRRLGKALSLEMANGKSVQP